MTTTYLVLVVALGAALGLWWVRRARRPVASPGPTPAGACGSLRALLLGTPRPEADLVERMAASLMDRTTMFGSSYAIPGHVGAVLGKGLFEAASAARAQLTAEVVERYQQLMTERARRLGRDGFVLPERYVLRVALARGQHEAVLASFDPIDDVHHALARDGHDGHDAGRPRVAPCAAPAPHAEPDRLVAGPLVDRGDATVLRFPTAERDDDATQPGGAGGAPTVVLSVAGSPLVQRRLDGATGALIVGRGEDVDLRCPDHLGAVSRAHAALAWIRGQAFVEDLGSANGTWLQRGDGRPERLAVGSPAALESGDTVWLADEHQATVAML